MAYLIRHTTPDIEKGICYGQADISLADSFPAEWEEISQKLPDRIDIIYSSPLNRCRILTEEMVKKYHINNVLYLPELMEMNFGEWELLAWDDIPKESLQKWMDNFTTEIVPGGESYELLYKRVLTWWKGVEMTIHENAVIVTHAGVIRCLLSYFHQTPLEQSFNLYPLSFGEVIKISYR